MRSTLEGDAAVVDDSRIREILLRQFGIRVGPEMGRYVLSRLISAPPGEPIAIMGGDARTGVAVRQVVAAGKLLGAINTTGSK
jgi:hypothetical protein